MCVRMVPSAPISMRIIVIARTPSRDVFFFFSFFVLPFRVRARGGDSLSTPFLDLCGRCSLMDACGRALPCGVCWRRI